MSKYWLEYVKGCYELVVESEGYNSIILDNNVEAYIVHLLARNMNRLDIGEKAIAISMLESINSGKKEEMLAVGDECLLIHSYPLKKRKWPTMTYYQDMGITAYGLADHVMERHFQSASKVLQVIFNRELRLKLN